MKVNHYVEFTGLLPKELKGMKAPIYGKVTELMGKTRVMVKPKYKHFEVVVAIADVTRVFKKDTVKKVPAKKAVIIWKSIPVKADVPKTTPKTEVPKAAPVCETKKDLKSTEPSVLNDPIVPTSKPEVVKEPVKEIKEKPVPVADAYASGIDPYQEDEGSGSLILYAVIAVIVVAAAVCTYYLLNL